jgi:hypothetical protein
MAFDPTAFSRRPLSSGSTTLVGAIDASFPAEVQAFADKEALFPAVKTEGNVICADDSPALMVADVNGQYIALNGTTRSWSEKGLGVLRAGKWYSVIDPDAADPKLGSGEVYRLIDVAL